MKLALECPKDCLEMVQPFADFDFILAQEVLKDKEYADFYTQSDKFKVVDNGANEKGESLSLEQLEEAFNKVGGHLVVSPDYLGECSRTLAAYPECVEKFGEDRVIGVLQGSTPMEALSCLGVYKGLVAVPYHVGSYSLDSPRDAPPWLMALRRALVVSNLPKDRQVYLFGFNDLEELSWYSGRPHVVAIDTGVPVLLGLLEQDILEPLSAKLDATFSKMQSLKLSQVKWAAICRNVALLRRYLS